MYKRLFAGIAVAFILVLAGQQYWNPDHRDTVSAIG